jgi:hypothetical protein
MTSQLPFRVVNIAAASACVVLLFIFIRRRIEPIVALLFLLPVLVLGAAWEALLLSLSMNFLLGLAAGLGMLLVLESKAPNADPIACLLLVVSLACGGIDLAFVAAAAADVAIRRDLRGVWIPGLPLAVIASGTSSEATSPAPIIWGTCLPCPTTSGRHRRLRQARSAG